MQVQGKWKGKIIKGIVAEFTIPEIAWWVHGYMKWFSCVYLNFSVLS